eukprot:34222-Chlamydomonas_euryale.AAC.1
MRVNAAPRMAAKRHFDHVCWARGLVNAAPRMAAKCHFIRCAGCIGYARVQAVHAEVNQVDRVKAGRAFFSPSSSIRSQPPTAHPHPRLSTPAFNSLPLPTSTLLPATQIKALAKVNPKVINSIQELCNDSNNTVVVFSGSETSKLEEIFAPLPVRKCKQRKPWGGAVSAKEGVRRGKESGSGKVRDQHARGDACAPADARTLAGDVVS